VTSPAPAVQVAYQRPPLYPKQEAALFDPARYAVVEASTKSGKTVGCIVWLHEQAALYGGPGRNFWWVAPIRPTARIAFRRLRRFLPPRSFRSNETEMTITLRNGATIFFKGAEKPDSLYGEDVFAAVIDEASRVRAESWHAVRSTLTATRGPIRIIGNVKGRRNWAFKMARRAELGSNPDYHYAKLTVWDAVEAGIFDEAEAEDARDVLPEAVFRELYLAEASDLEEAFFDVSRLGAVAGYPSTAKLARGWDFAVSEPKPGVEPDYTVGAKLAQDGRRTYVVDVVRFRGAPDRVTDQMMRTAAADGRICDQVYEQESGSAGKLFVEQMRRTMKLVDGAGRVFASPVTGGKIVRAYHFAAAVNDNRVSLVEGDWHDAYRAELDEFPESAFDDQVDGSAHAYNLLNQRSRTRLRFV